MEAGQADLGCSTSTHLSGARGRGPAAPCIRVDFVGRPKPREKVEKRRNKALKDILLAGASSHSWVVLGMGRQLLPEGLCIKENNRKRWRVT